jgi:hypothetical protein
VFLVGMKADLEHKRQVPKESAIAFQRKHSLTYFTESSSLDGTNITKLF